MEYKVFTKDILCVGDLYLSPVGGFSVQACIVHDISRRGFKYRNSKFTGYHDFDEQLEGVLIKGNTFYGALRTLEEITGLWKLEEKGESSAEPKLLLEDLAKAA